MGFYRMLVQVTWVGVILSVVMAAAATEYQVALPDCPKKCGNVTIPYPFGMTEDCHLNDTARNFLVKCNLSDPTAQPKIGVLKVTNISIEGEINILKPRNLDSSQNVTDGNCFGIGCCQMKIPEGLKHVSFKAYSFNQYKNVFDFSPCSYAFIIQEDKFKFSKGKLTSLRKTKRLPMVLDWAVGDERCEAAQKKENYLCGANSKCVDLNFTSGPGYRCDCEDGYEGNPYLKDGCQDINECEVEKNNTCKSKEKCVNVPGSYHCECIEGYHLDMEACVADQPARKSSLAINLSVGVGIGLIVMLICSSSLYFIVKQRNLINLREKFFKQNGGLILQQLLSGQENLTETAKIFTTEELKKATNNYDETLIIGRGGFGTVYKGFLPDNRIVAIKKSKMVDENQIEQFINEIVVLSQINHRNVVKLLGCCLENPVPLLVYEFVPNGTLFEYIHNENKISWETRLRIAIESAEALSYLHSAASTPIIHRDVKPSNILLDSSYTAKVSDFGASRLIPLDQTELATMVQGTIGYLDPEYLQTSQLTDKSDVYSFGVILVELLTGRKALSFDKPEVERSLVTYFLLSLKENRLFEVLEKHITNEGNAKQLKEVANIAKKCLKLKGEDRPTMKEVATELEGLRRMEKHSWVNADFNSEETEHLLARTSNSSKYDVRNNSADIYDSVNTM
ncbi:putative wall-associated receptor kinase-like 16 [Quercus lobata]|uniref:putative wall-associated receptor kinase-like 16 n=1 Tax=Quercus lobata TaxID=97700 RepID=UPI0012483DB7|nr:putative wall-associated receptor kinase-like 16 [Quercus lobata]